MIESPFFFIGRTVRRLAVPLRWLCLLCLLLSPVHALIPFSPALEAAASTAEKSPAAEQESADPACASENRLRFSHALPAARTTMVERRRPHPRTDRVMLAPHADVNGCGAPLLC